MCRIFVNPARSRAKPPGWVFFIIKKTRYYTNIANKHPFREKGPTLEKKETLPGTQQGRAQNLGQQMFFEKGLDPICKQLWLEPLTQLTLIVPSFTYTPCLVKIREIQKHIQNSINIILFSP